MIKVAKLSLGVKFAPESWTDEEFQTSAYAQWLKDIMKHTEVNALIMTSHKITYWFRRKSE